MMLVEKSKVSHPAFSKLYLSEAAEQQHRKASHRLEIVIST